MPIPQSASSTTANQMTVEQLLGQYAAGDPEKFAIFFRRMRNTYPKDCTRACLRYLGDYEGTAVSRQMLLWLCSGIDYCATLFDPEITSGGGARQAATALRDSDPQFFTKLSRFLVDPRVSKSQPVILRVLHVIPALGDCGVVIPWLRGLENHSDDQIRMQSAKALCELRPTRAMVERQLQSNEPQTRADAIEALWKTRGSEAKTMFRFALVDPDHRVVANALVGLHLNDDNTAVEKMIELTRHRSAMFRISMATAMAHTADLRCIPALLDLLEDTFPAVREAARAALGKFPAEALVCTFSPTAALPAGEARKPEPSVEEQLPARSQPAEVCEEPASAAFETPAFRLL